MRIECSNPLEVVKEAFWLAWRACGRPQGMGFLQDNPNADKEAVWNQVYERGDYPGGNTFPGCQNKLGKVYGDYVFGRMMKLGIDWDDTSITVRDTEPRFDYQAWSGRYPSYQKLIEAAIESVAMPA